ncbi:hypothetical protein [Herbaspirillum sp. alder98]|jgi:hypothetical protein|uniref:hypothetical protein n=1 Tax=Herbaspirillum sp. alder98 TaxID=2913096 RepID=UPI001CD89C1B|nr:hypothetical protein [Herbaspirillum sp. alder98]MCA1322886.1 hypothetical protein [Herbaspirillum sp. alder98]
MSRVEQDFRITFARMADHAIVSKREFAELLATTVGALTQMKYRGQLPHIAFPGKKRDCWYAKDIRQWFEGLTAAREQRTLSDLVETSTISKRIGRPRKTTT